MFKDTKFFSKKKLHLNGLDKDSGQEEFGLCEEPMTIGLEESLLRFLWLLVVRSTGIEEDILVR